MSDPVSISDAEWIVMEVLWRWGGAAAGDVIHALSDQKDWNHRTIRTLLARLVEKGVVETVANGNRSLYRPAVRREKCVRQESRSFLEKVFGGDASELLVHFVRNSKMSADELQRLRKLLDDKLSERD